VHIHKNCSFASTDATAAGGDEEEKEERMRRRRGWFLLEYWSMKVSK